MSWTSRHRRKRNRRRLARTDSTPAATQPPSEGDRRETPENPRGLGANFQGEPLLYDWANATRGDMRLLRTAIRRGWTDPLPPANKKALVDAVLQACRTGSNRLILAAAWAFIEMDEANHKLLMAELDRQQS